MAPVAHEHPGVRPNNCISIGPGRESVAAVGGDSAEVGAGSVRLGGYEGEVVAEQVMAEQEGNEKREMEDDAGEQGPRPNLRAAAAKPDQDDVDQHYAAGHIPRRLCDLFAREPLSRRTPTGAQGKTTTTTVWQWCAWITRMLPNGCHHKLSRGTGLRGRLAGQSARVKVRMMHGRCGG